MWTKILGFILDKDNHRFLLLAGLVVAIFIGVQQCNKKQEYKQDVTKQKNNIAALQDTVGYYENKAGELTADKLALQTDKKQLKTLNKNLYDELEKERDHVEQLTQINTELVADSSEVDTTSTNQLDDNHWRFDWNLSRSGEQWRRVLTGYTEFYIDSSGVPFNPNTMITRDLLRMQLITGILDDDGQKRIFVRSTYPNLKVTDIQGAIIRESPINKSPSRFGLGLTLGGGYTPQGFQPYVGLGINYNFIRL